MRNGIRRAAWAGAIFSVALLLRAAGWPRVFTPQGLIPPLGADEYFHLRRIWYSVVRFPEVFDRDPYASYPTGGEVSVAPGFDLAIAALARLLVGADDQAAVEVVAAWVPPVLGAFCAVVAAFIAWRAFSPAAGVLSGVLLALLPAHFVFSQVGMVDHHVAAALAAALLVAGALVAAQRPPGSRWPGLAACLGLGAALFLLTWAGGLLTIALLQALGVVWMLQAGQVSVAISRARHLALAHAVAAAVLAPYCLGRSWEYFGSWSPLALCNFQPVWFAAGAGTCAVLPLVWTRRALGASAARRWLSATALAALTLAGSLAAIPELGSSLVHATDWFRSDDEFLRHIAELAPLFGGSRGWGTRFAESQFTRLIYVYPFAFGWLLHRAVRGGRADHWLLVVWSGSFCVLTLAQIRFENTFSVSYAIVLGGALVTLARQVRQRLTHRSWIPRATLIAAALGAVYFAALPSLRFMEPRVSMERSDFGGSSRRFRNTRGYRIASLWLRDHTPVTQGYLDPEGSPEYGVLVRWDRGHQVRYVAERPQVQDNSGFYAGPREFEAAGRYYAAEDEKEAVRILTELGVRYVFVDHTGSAHGYGQAPRSMARRLYVPILPRSVSEEKPHPIQGLRQHRLIAETAPNRALIAHLMIYELVSGATLRGEAKPGAVVYAVLPIRSSVRRAPFVYRARTRADGRGAYRFVLPYANDAEGMVRTAPEYVLHCASESASAVVSEKAVVDGLEVPGPTLECGAAPASGIAHPPEAT